MVGETENELNRIGGLVMRSGNLLGPSLKVIAPKTVIRFGCLVLLVGCGSDGSRASDFDATPDGLEGSDLVIAADTLGGSTIDMTRESPPTIDSVTIDAPGILVFDGSRESPQMVDAGACKGEVGNLSVLGWVEPCPSLVDAGVPTLSCHGYVGARISEALCNQRQTLSWEWGTHGMTCFYEQGALAGLKMWNDTLAFCGNASFSMEVGAVVDCPASTETLVLDCSPFADGGIGP